MGAKIFTYFIFLFLSGVVILLFLLLIFYHDVPQKTQSIEEYEKYINIINSNGTATICTKVIGDFFSTSCIESITINNKDNLITYINHKYNTDVLKDIEGFNKKIEEYRNSKNNR